MRIASRAALVSGLCLVLLAAISTPIAAKEGQLSAEAIWMKDADGRWCLEADDGGFFYAEPIPGVTLHPISGARVLVTMTDVDANTWTIDSETFLTMSGGEPEPVDGSGSQGANNGENGEPSDSGLALPRLALPSNMMAPLAAFFATLLLTFALVASVDEPTRARVTASLGRFSDLSVVEGPGTLAGNYQRGRITGFLTAHPGCHLSGMIRALELGNHQAVHHLRILEHDGKVWCRRDGRLLRYYTDRVNREAELSRLPRPVDVNQLSDVALMILKSIAEQAPNATSPTQRELAANLKTSQQLISHHLRRLETQGLISRERKGLRTRRVLTAEGERSWARLQIPEMTST